MRKNQESTHSRSRKIYSCYCNEYSFGASNKKKNKKYTDAINRHYRSDTQIYKCKIENKIKAQSYKNERNDVYVVFRSLTLQIAIQRNETDLKTFT